MLNSCCGSTLDNRKVYSGIVADKYYTTYYHTYKSQQHLMTDTWVAVDCKSNGKDTTIDFHLEEDEWYKYHIGSKIYVRSYANDLAYFYDGLSARYDTKPIRHD